MRVLVTGSRDWDDAETIRAALDAQLGVHGAITVIHAAAPGAERIAGEWARERILARDPVRLEVHPPVAPIGDADIHLAFTRVETPDD